MLKRFLWQEKVLQFFHSFDRSAAIRHRRSIRSDRHRSRGKTGKYVRSNAESALAENHGPGKGHGIRCSAFCRLQRKSSSRQNADDSAQSLCAGHIRFGAQGRDDRYRDPKQAYRLYLDGRPLSSKRIQ